MAESILSLVGLMITASLVNNVVLSQFLGLCPFLGVSKKTDTALGMGGACIFVITLASLVCSIIYKFILTREPRKISAKRKKNSAKSAHFTKKNRQSQ